MNNPGKSAEAELAELLELTDLAPEFEEASTIATHLFPRGENTAAAVDPASLSDVEAALLDRRDTRALLSGARVQSGWWSRAGYVVRLLVPSPRRWRALAVSEQTSVASALARHVGRVVGRGRAKLARAAQSTAPGDSPRSRLFRRRGGH